MIKTLILQLELVTSGNRLLSFYIHLFPRKISKKYKFLKKARDFRGHNTSLQIIFTQWKTNRSILYFSFVRHFRNSAFIYLVYPVQ